MPAKIEGGGEANDASELNRGPRTDPALVAGGTGSAFIIVGRQSGNTLRQNIQYVDLLR